MQSTSYKDMTLINENKHLLKIAAMIGLILTVLLMAYFISIDLFNHPEIIQTKLESTGALAPLVFFLISIINSVYPVIPGGMGSVIGYTVFGPVFGFTLAFIANLIGSTILFYLVKRFGPPLLSLFFKEKTINKGLSYINKGSYMDFMLALVFVVPGLPDDLFIMISGLSKMSYKRMLLIQIIFKPLTMYLYMAGVNNLLAFISTGIF